MCDRHQPVPERRFEFGPYEFQYGSEFITIWERLRTFTDGLGCPACGSFEPSAPPAHRGREQRQPAKPQAQHT